MAKPLKIGPFGVRGFGETQQHLMQYLQSGRVHPALLLTGPDATSKLALATGLAKWLLCPNKSTTGEMDPNCPACTRIDRSVHPDVYILSEPGASIKIESVRELCHQMEVASMEGGPKICIVDECHQMTAAAANAFLKSLEEPGPNRYFIFLTTQPGSLLDTIISRCLQFRTTPDVDSEEGFPKEEADFETMFAEFLATENTIALKKLGDREAGVRFIRFLQRQTRAAIFDAANSLLSERGEYHNLMAFEAALQTEGKMRSNANHTLLIENLLVKHFTKDAQL